MLWRGGGWWQRRKEEHLRCLALPRLPWCISTADAQGPAAGSRNPCSNEAWGCGCAGRSSFLPVHGLLLRPLCLRFPTPRIPSPPYLPSSPSVGWLPKPRGVQSHSPDVHDLRCSGWESLLPADLGLQTDRWPLLLAGQPRAKHAGLSSSLRQFRDLGDWTYPSRFSLSQKWDYMPAAISHCASSPW